MTSFSIPNMDCGHCAQRVEKALRTVDGITEVNVDLESRTAEVEGSFEKDAAVKAVEEAGYTVA